MIALRQTKHGNYTFEVVVADEDGYIVIRPLSAYNGVKRIISKSRIQLFDNCPYVALDFIGQCLEGIGLNTKQIVKIASEIIEHTISVKLEIEEMGGKIIL